MSLSVVYALRRDELWHWYKRAWTRTLWPFHAAMLVMPIAVFVSQRGESSLIGTAVFGVFVGAAGCALMVAYPQIRYRADMRTLTIDETGVRGVRGKTDYFVKWGRIARVEDDGDYLVISERKLNAFIIPSRAFASDADRAAFRGFAAEMIATSA